MFLFQSFWVRVPLVAPTEQLDDLIEGPEELSDRKPDDSWHWYDNEVDTPIH